MEGVGADGADEFGEVGGRAHAGQLFMGEGISALEVYVVARRELLFGNTRK